MSPLVRHRRDQPANEREPPTSEVDIFQNENTQRLGFARGRVKALFKELPTGSGPQRIFARIIGATLLDDDRQKADGDGR
jgi:hypothetical protein